MNTHDPTDVLLEARYQILKHLEKNPAASQRDIAAALGLSLGKVNYCIRALIDKGVLKARNFTNSKRKSAYKYVLTPSGMKEKLRLTYAFLQRKMAEFDRIRVEIATLNAEIANQQEP